MNTTTNDLTTQGQKKPATPATVESILDDAPPKEIRSIFQKSKWHLVRSGQIWCACPKKLMSEAAWRIWAAAFTPYQLWDEKCEHCRKMVESGNQLIAVMTQDRELVGIEFRPDATYEMVRLLNPLSQPLAR